MSRDPLPNEPEIDDRAERNAVPAQNDRSRDRSSDAPALESRDDRPRPELDDSVRAYYLRDRTYFLRESEFNTLVEIGKFRVVDSADLAHFAYGGDAERMARDLRRLDRQGLAARKPVAQEPKRSERLVVLTKKAKRLLLNSGRVPQGQAIYHGLVKPRELKHDAALYRLYQKEANRIARAGGRPLRLVLDYELKRNVQRELTGLGDAAQARDAREQVAARHGLALVGDRIQIPDLRLEYETADHEHRETNLELATRNYRPRALAQKAKAGFSIYAPREDASKLRRILDESELTARIFSL
jgi:hypothetical protein